MLAVSSLPVTCTHGAWVSSQDDAPILQSVHFHSYEIQTENCIYLIMQKRAEKPFARQLDNRPCRQQPTIDVDCSHLPYTFPTSGVVSIIRTRHQVLEVYGAKEAKEPQARRQEGGT